MNGIHSEAADKLFEAIISLDSVEDCYAFFEDLCTFKEIKDMSQRLEVACLLNKGMSYTKVSEMTNVSSATISRVKRCLDYGAGGYAKALSLLEEKK